MLKNKPTTPNDMNDATGRKREPIAIIGIGCRFPSGASSPDKFWNLLSSGTDAIVDVPADRWSLDKFYDPDPEVPGKMFVKQGGFLREDISRFDAPYFNISPREALHLDPQQRLLLEVAHEAFEDAGMPPSQLRGSNLGVYVGGFCLDRIIMELGNLNRQIISSHSSTGGTMAMLSNRLSHVFDLRGPSMSVDTACSASLVALHMACQSLWSGETSMALCGGVNVMLKPEYTIVMCKGRFLSPTARCKAFSEEADGYVRGEGAGVVLLKPLNQALADGDQIYAMIRGTAVNQDGRTKGIAAPSMDAQIKLMKRAYANAGIEPSDVDYVEAHGTGTQAGDPVEWGALSNVVGKGRKADDECLVGSVKTNIGHLEAAAGIAGIIKTALCLRHNKIPEHLHFKNPNSKIDFENSGLRVSSQLQDWPQQHGPAIAAVNSFGYGGTNAHAVLQAAPSPCSNTISNEICHPRASHDNTPVPPERLMIPLSARTPEALMDMAHTYHEAIETGTLFKDVELIEAVREMAEARDHHRHRLAIHASTNLEFKERLAEVIREEPNASTAIGECPPAQAPEWVFVYTGMGPQWWGMGQELLTHSSVFKETVKDCCERFKQLAGWSLWDELNGNESDSQMARTSVAQTANFVLQVGLTALWQSMGITPTAVVGHSVGEVASAYVSGALSLDDALLVSYHRSRLQQQLAGQGTMLAVGLSEAEILPYLSKHASKISLAAINAPSAVTLAGSKTALQKLANELEKEGCFARFLNVEVPYHSHKMDPIKAEVLEMLQQIEPMEPTIPLYSTVTAKRVTGQELNAAYWWKNIRQPVRFADTLSTILQDKHLNFLEVGPHPVLATSIKEILRHQDLNGTLLHSLNRKHPEWKTFMETLGQLYVNGMEVNWENLNGKSQRHVSLPSYPWQMETYWIETEAATQDRIGSSDHFKHPYLASAIAGPELAWECELSPHVMPYLPDHRVQGNVVFPGAGYVECGIALGRKQSPETEVNLEDIKFLQALSPNEKDRPTLRTELDPTTGTFKIHSRNAALDDAWRLHAKGRYVESPYVSEVPSISMDAIRSRCENKIEGPAFYERMKQMGLEYGPCFKSIKNAWSGQNEVLAEIELNTNGGVNPSKYYLHPTLLDASFQSLLGAVEQEDKESGGQQRAYIPVAIDRIRYFGPSGVRAFSHGIIVKQTDSEISGDINIYDEAGRIILELKGLHCQALSTANRLEESALQEVGYQYAWELSSDAPGADTSNNSKGRWLLFGDQKNVCGELALRLAEQGNELTVMQQAESRGSFGLKEFFANKMIRSESTDEPLSELQGAVFLWDSDTSSDQNSWDKKDSVGSGACASLLALTQALTTAKRAPSFRLCIITSNAHQVDGSDESVDPLQTAIWGLGRVIANEHPELDVRLLDVSREESAGNIAQILEVLSTSAPTLEAGIRAGKNYLHKLTQVSMKDLSEIEREASGQDADAPFALEVGQPGLLESLRFRATETRDPNPGEIQMDVHFVALNFKDVLKVMGKLSATILDGTYFGTTLGMESSGVVTKVGPGVTDYKIGDKVIAFIPGGFRSSLTLSTSYVQPKPEHFSLEEIPVLIPMLTVIHGLEYLARLEKGERVLIHAATGGVGLAAIQYAQWRGAEIFATAGSDEKRAYLRSLGVQHVMNSRSLDFADEIMAQTNGEGVHVVLNSLHGDALRKSISVLAPYGRFIEIGKRDIDLNNGLELAPFNRNLMFASVDLDRMFLERNDLIRRHYARFLDGIKGGHIRPLPTKVFPADEVSDAFRFLGQAKHMGKVVISMKIRPEHVLEKAREPIVIQNDASYLVTGGLGGFGLEVAKWLVKEGATSLILAGRRGRETPGAQEAIRALEEKGVTVLAAAVDISNEQQVSELFNVLKAECLPLKGIFHAAMVLDDAPIMELNEERMSRVLAPKAGGALILHRLTQEIALDCFVMFSSVSSLIGNPGQGNYSAANAYLDGLARMRSAQGLPGLSINLGAIADVGVVARDVGLINHLERMGLHALPPAKILSAMKTWLNLDPAQIGIINMDWARWAKGNPGIAETSCFKDLIATCQSEGSDNQVISKADKFLNKLKGHDSSKRAAAVEARFTQDIASILRVPVAKLDTGSRLTTELGFDSLLSAELQNVILDSFGIELTAIDIARDPLVTELSECIYQRLEERMETLAIGHF